MLQSFGFKMNYFSIKTLAMVSCHKTIYFCNSCHAIILVHLFRNMVILQHFELVEQLLSKLINISKFTKKIISMMTIIFLTTKIVKWLLWQQQSNPEISTFWNIVTDSEELTLLSWNLELYFFWKSYYLNKLKLRFKNLIIILENVL